MFRWIAFALACLLSGLPAQAQTRPYNPYAPSDDFQAPVRPDGKLHWPEFFKSAGLEARFQMYFRMGSCKGTKASINEMLRENKVDVDSLAETSITGKAVSTRPGIVTVADSSGMLQSIVIHPAGVTKIDVDGKLLASGLTTEMLVRMQGRVDAHGVGLEPIGNLEVISASPEIVPHEIEPEHLQTIVGTITRVYGAHKVQLKVASGKLRRMTLTLTDEPAIDVHGHSLTLIAPGDEIQAEGHSYSGKGVRYPTIFASKVIVTKTLAEPSTEISMAHGKNAGSDHR